jgi:hypothetical protein
MLKGEVMSEDMKIRISKRLSIILKGKTPSRNTIEAARIANRKPKSEEHKRKISETLTGKTQSQETIAKRVTKTRGMKRTQETIKRLSESNIGKHSGERSGMWKGGSSFEPYCPKFNERFKERVRDYFGHKCVECGSSEGEKRLSIHHVTYNKKTCCDDTKPLFVSLCRACHAKTHKDREYWRIHFTDIINSKYGGKSYDIR